MDFAYYIVRKSDMTILDGTSDMVSAINLGQQQGCACLVLQACVITEVGKDEVPQENFLENPLDLDDVEAEEAASDLE